jgi:hypothetical protein
MNDVTYGTAADLTPGELTEFYKRLGHEVPAQPQQLQSMLGHSAAFVTARVDGKLVGLARGLCDGVRGYLTECKLDPAYQGPAAITRRDGRIEDDRSGIAAEMARRVLMAMAESGVKRIDVLAWGTEVDFCEELGFKRQGGLVGLTMPATACGAFAAQPAGAAS